jgi:RNA polymerase sigma-70 factor (ECF subfamily)
MTTLAPTALDGLRPPGAGSGRRSVPDPPPQVVERARAGDRAAFAALYAHYYAAIRNFLYRIFEDSADADEFAQDAFVKAYRGLPHIAGELKFGAWLYRIATNVARDALRHRALVRWERFDGDSSPFTPALAARWKHWATEDAVEESSSAHRQGYDLVVHDRSDDPEQAALDAEVAAQVRDVLDRLCTRYRVGLELREYHDLSYDEIAEVLGTTRAGVKSLLFRARREFGRYWQRAEGQRAAGDATPRGHRALGAPAGPRC